MYNKQASTRNLESLWGNLWTVHKLTNSVSRGYNGNDYVPCNHTITSTPQLRIINRGISVNFGEFGEFRWIWSTSRSVMSRYYRTLCTYSPACRTAIIRTYFPTVAPSIWNRNRPTRFCSIHYPSWDDGSQENSESDTFLYLLINMFCRMLFRLFVSSAISLVFQLTEVYCGVEYRRGWKYNININVRNIIE